MEAQNIFQMRWSLYQHGCDSSPECKALLPISCAEWLIAWSHHSPMFSHRSCFVPLSAPKDYLVIIYWHYYDGCETCMQLIWMDVIIWCHEVTWYTVSRNMKPENIYWIRCSYTPTLSDLIYMYGDQMIEKQMKIQLLMPWNSARLIEFDRCWCSTLKFNIASLLCHFVLTTIFTNPRSLSWYNTYFRVCSCIMCKTWSSGLSNVQTHCVSSNTLNRCFTSHGAAVL